MKKHLPLIITIAIILITGGVLWWRDNQPKISLDQAKLLAIENAQVVVNQVNFQKAELNRKNDEMIYEIEFEIGGDKYKYKIDGETKQIVSEGIEEAPMVDPKNTSSNTKVIGEDKAREIAAKGANLRELDISSVKWKLYYQSDLRVYKITLRAAGLGHYVYIINATTGEVIKKEHHLIR